jgi:ABC-type amino acid transport substrate-binding protein
MRWTLAALPLLALAAPLPATAADRDMQGAVAVLNDPATQDRMADTVAMLVGAMMRLNVGPLAEAVAQIDPDSGAAMIPPDATLGEVTGRDPDYADRMGDDVRASARMAGRAVSALSIYAPVLKDMARDLAAQWEREREAARR